MKKGFTLIELLAVILILGIIALIAIPTITSIIEDSKRTAFIRTSETIMNEIETECNLKKIKGENHKIVYSFDNERTSKIGVKGKLPSSGGVMIVDDECTVSANFTDGKYCVVGSNKSAEINAGELVDNKCIVKETNTPSCTNSDENPGAFDEEGTLEDPYLIESIEDLYSIKSMDAAGTQDKHFKLAVDLDFKDDCSYANPSNTTYKDINKDNKTEGMKEEVNKGQGFKYKGNNIPVFAGNFDGNNKTIKNLYISGVGYDEYAGLFERVQNTTNSVYFKDLTLENVNIGKMKQYIGSLIGSIEVDTMVNISNINASGNITAASYTGGVIGRSYSESASTFDNLVFNGSIKCSASLCGGIIGKQFKTVEEEEQPIIISNITSVVKIDCFNGCGGAFGDIEVTNLNNIYTYGFLSNEDMPELAQANFGGIAGRLKMYGNGEAKNLYNYTSLKLDNNAGTIGGLFGELGTYESDSEPADKAKVINAFNYGDLNIISTLGRIGGIAGIFSESECNNCNNYGNLYVPYSYMTINDLIGQGGNNTLIDCNNYGTITVIE